MEFQRLKMPDSILPLRFARAVLPRRLLGWIRAGLMTSLSGVGLACVGGGLPLELKSFVAANCLECHDSSVRKGGLDLTALEWDPAKAWVSRDWPQWIRIHDRVGAGEMPPVGRAGRPGGDEVGKFTNELGGMILGAERSREAREGRGLERRLNRLEYEATLRELLSLPALEVRQFLPEDSEVDGFNKSQEALGTSHVQMAGYLEAGEYALRQAMAPGVTMPESRVRRYYAWDQWEFFGVINLTGPGQPRERKAMGVLVSSYEPTEIRFGRFRAPVDGKYRLSISAYSFWHDPKQGRGLPGRRREPVTLYAEKPPRILRKLGEFDAMPDPTVSTIEVWLKAGETIRPDAARLGRPRPPDFKNPLSTPEGTPGVAFQWLEVEGPLFEQWPPVGHRLLFDDLEIVELPEAVGAGTGRAATRGGSGIQVIPKDAGRDIERLMRRFLGVAYRRSVEGLDVARFAGLVRGAIQNGHSFTDAMIAGYTAVLSSPGFLGVGAGGAGWLDEDGLAERLSYFLWNSPPDGPLRALAAKRELGRPEIMRGEVDRLLNDPRSGRFVEAFLDYWLDLRRLGDSTPDAQLYPEYQLDDLLVESLPVETRLFFEELLRRDLGVVNLVNAPFTYLNERLAEHYGIAGVEGVRWRRVELPQSSVRGGLLTHGSVLKVTANGTTTSPVKRGAWVLDRILGTPPLPPPGAVPAIEPDTVGAVTIRELLARHRSQESCNVCHRRIDPAGFALESFDVMGGWRERYRILGSGDVVPGIGHDGNRFRFGLGSAVDPSGQLPDGREFRNVRDLKTLLVRDPDMLARNLLRQWIVYSTGAPVRFGDRAEVEAILGRTRGQGHGVRTLLREWVLSELFRKK